MDEKFRKSFESKSFSFSFVTKTPTLCINAFSALVYLFQSFQRRYAVLIQNLVLSLLKNFTGVFTGLIHFYNAFKHMLYEA